MRAIIAVIQRIRKGHDVLIGLGKLPILLVTLSTLTQPALRLTNKQFVSSPDLTTLCMLFLVIGCQLEYLRRQNT